MRKLAHNTTDRVRWSIVQTAPRRRVIRHYSCEERAEKAMARYLCRPHGSGIGPMVQIWRMEKGEYLQ
jgi:hypothetical protein